LKPLPAGTAAPDFELKTTPDQSVCLHDFRGKNVVLAFYPADWSLVCSDQLALYQQLLPEFEKLNEKLRDLSQDMDEINAQTETQAEHAQEMAEKADELAAKAAEISKSGGSIELTDIPHGANLSTAFLLIML